MQNFTHTADISIVKVKYVHRQTIFSVLFMLFILNSVKKILLNAEELTDEKSANNFNKIN